MNQEIEQNLLTQLLSCKTTSNTYQKQTLLCDTSGRQNYTDINSFHYSLVLLCDLDFDVQMVERSESSSILTD
jgi:hypothetical protein